MWFVVIYSNYLQATEALVGPFNTRSDARAWGCEHDDELRSDEKWKAMSPIPPKATKRSPVLG